MSLSNPTNPPILNEAVSKSYLTRVLESASDENQTKVNQIHGINPTGSTGAGIPKPVTNVSASVSNASAGATSVISVNFQRDPSDKNFSRVVIFAKGYQGNNSPVQVGSGADSPATVILNNTGEAVSLIVQSIGNGGSSPFASSPTCSIKLPQNANGGFGPTSTTNLTTGQVVQSAPPTLVTLVVLPTAMPWNQTINSGSPFGSNDGTAATQAGLALVPGQKIAVAYASGGVIVSSGASQTTDLQGDPNVSPAPGPPFTPSHYVSGSTLKVGGLVGAFTDSHGVVKGFFDLSGGSGSTFIVPAGASRVQFGVNDTLYNDNTGPGYTVVVAIVASSVLIKVSGTPTSTQDTLNLVAGANVTLTPSGSNVTIASSGGGGGTTSIAQGARKRFFASSNGNNQWDSSPGNQIGDLPTLAAGTNTPVYQANKAATTLSGTVTTVFNTNTNTYCGWTGKTNWITGRTIDAQFQAFAYAVTGTGFRFLFGFFSTTTPSNSDTAICTRYACFRASSVAGDTNWQAIASNNNGVGQTVVNTGVAININTVNNEVETMHRFGIKFDDVNSQILFYIDAALVATITTNMPASGNSLCWGVLGSWITTNNGLLVGIGQVIVESDL